MTWLRRVLDPTAAVQIRRPDYVEARDGCFLQIWGEEGYWHVADEEFRDFLVAVEEPKPLREVFHEHPHWRTHQRSICTQLKTMGRSGLGGSARTSSAAVGWAAAIENLTINLVTACNLHCRTCYVPDGQRSGVRLNTDQIIRFLEALRPRFSTGVTLSLLGGEPFLHPEGMLTLGRWAREHRILCNVSTSGTVTSTRVFEVLQATGMKVQVSLDGASAAVNDAIRGPGTFDQAIACLRKLVECRIPTAMCMVCCGENLADLRDYFRLARELNVPEVRFIPLKQLGNARDGQVAPASQLAVVSAICRELEADPSLATMCHTDIYSIIRAMLRETSRRATCGTGTQTLLVQADGTVYPCINTTLPELALGHIERGVDPILEAGAAFGRRVSLDSLAHPCYRCVVKRWCLAVCPGETWQQNGQLASPHWNCEDVRETLIFMMWRLATEHQISRQPVTRSLI